jgi:hypothetical protein
MNPEHTQHRLGSLDAAILKVDAGKLTLQLDHEEDYSKNSIMIDCS